MNRKKQVGLAAILFLLLVGVSAGVYGLYRMQQGSQKIPTTRVKRGNVELDVYASGDVRSPDSVALAVPAIGNQNLQIVNILKMGASVQEGDTVIQFDPSDQEYNVEQNRARLLQAEQDITKMKADSAVQSAQDKVALLRAKFDVRRAELEVQKNELVGEIDAKKNILALNETKRRLEQLQQDIKTRELVFKANMAVAQERFNQAKLNLRQAQDSINALAVKSPIQGLISVRENQENAGWMAHIPGVVFPEFREGDVIKPGRYLVDVLDLDAMEVLVKVNESDRANVSPGQPVEIEVDVAPGLKYPGKVKAIAGLASRRGFGNSAQRKFDAIIEITQPDGRLRRGATARVRIQGNELQDKLLLPRQCVFEKNGKQIIYVRKGSGFEAREVKVGNRTESRIVVENIPEGTEVALLNPEQNRKAKSRGPSGPTGGGQ